MDLLLILIILVVLYLIFLHIYYSDSNLTLQYRIPESRSVISDTVFNTNVGKVEEMKKKSDNVSYPEISYPQKALSKLPKIDSGDMEPKSSPFIEMVRDKQNRYYIPDFYRKDRLSGNTIGTTEYGKFELDNNKANQAWSDENVSNYPKYYTSDIKDELTDTGSFFDNENQFTDKTSHKSTSLVSDSCFVSKDGSKFCNDNTRLQNIPPKLIEDPKKSMVLQLLNNIGVTKDLSIEDKYPILSKNESIMNGGKEDSLYGYQSGIIYDKCS
tara:strand:- start:4404 stop:5213 length:810 start_codon:yes stop_codon:yes gene_type:complete